MPPGPFYINPYAEVIVPVEVRSHKAELTDIEFPSAQTVSCCSRGWWWIMRAGQQAPEMLVRLTDEGILHQRDETPQEQLENEVLQKVILPCIRGYSRIEGSNFNAHDFILSTVVEDGPKTVNAREALQQALLAKVKPRCRNWAWRFGP